MRRFAPTLLILLVFGGLLVLALRGSGERAPDHDSDTPPQRIVSTLPGITEMVAHLGAGDRLVAVTPHCDMPPDVVAAVSTRISVMPLDLEGLVAAKPDLVLVDKTMLSAELPRLREHVSHVVVLETSRSLDGLGNALTRLAEALHDQEATRRAAAWNRELRETRAALRAKHVRADGAGAAPRVLVVGWFEPLHVLGRGSLMHDMLLALGAENVAADVAAASAPFAQEAVLARDPDVILHFGQDIPAEVRALWAPVRAMKRGWIYSVERDDVARAGPRILEGLHALAPLVHGEGS